MIKNVGELIELLKMTDSVEELDCNREDIAAIIPEVRIMFDYDQHNPYHCYDLWIHSLHVVKNLPADIDDDMLYLAALLHDIGKPDTQTFDPSKEGLYSHFYGHAIKSAQIVSETILPRLNREEGQIDQDQERRLLYYVLHHDDPMSLRLKTIRRELKEASFDEYKLMLKLQIADAKGHTMLPDILNRIEICEELLNGRAEELYNEILNGL